MAGRRRKRGVRGKDSSNKRQSKERRRKRCKCGRRERERERGGRLYTKEESENTGIKRRNNRNTN